MNKIISISIALCLILTFICISSADILPNGTNVTHRNIPSETNLEVIGTMSSKQSYQITSSSNGTNASDLGFLDVGERSSSLIYKNSQMTNGGYLAQSKGLNLDEGAQQKGGYNVGSTTVTTYLTDPEKGSKMSSDESLQLFTSGNYSRINDTVRNPLVSNIINKYVGGFNSQYSGSAGVELTSGQVGTIAKARSIGQDTSVPAELSYHMGIHPDLSSGMPYASGSVNTEFAVSKEEGAANTTNLSSTSTLKDSTSVDGEIFTFGKSFDVTSGVSPE